MSENIEPRKTYCGDCLHRRVSIGDCHVGCNLPVDAQLIIDYGGDERYTAAQKTVDFFLEKGLKVAVRAFWNDCGIFPVIFDENIIFGCANFQEGQPDGKSDKFYRAFFQVPLIARMKITQVDKPVKDVLGDELGRNELD